MVAEEATTLRVFEPVYVLPFRKRTAYLFVDKLLAFDQISVERFPGDR